jgi:predicted metal-dependent phosphoesterase TrpH
MKIDLHTHTKHSFDCQTDVGSLVKRAEKAGLDAIAIADHDTMSACGIAGETAESLAIIPAMEITSSGGTHIIGLFLRDEVQSREIHDIIDEIHDQKGLVLIPHPFRPETGLFYNKEKNNQFTGEETAMILSRIDLIEAVNFRCRPGGQLETHKFLAERSEIAQTAGSDAHLVEEIGKAYVELEKVSSGSLESIKEALLFSPRTIRYEVYSAEKLSRIEEVRIEGVKKSTMLKAKGIIPAPVRNSIRTLYRKSAGRLVESRRRKPKPGSNETGS